MADFFRLSPTPVGKIRLPSFDDGAADAIATLPRFPGPWFEKIMSNILSC